MKASRDKLISTQVQAPEADHLCNKGRTTDSLSYSSTPEPFWSKAKHKHLQLGLQL